ncbi:MAG TPA: hypothetical protein PLP27_05495 [Crocinitomicaceae bacterium]|nr:hypothetical protein [Crocinitomicaceae bacterium]
MKTQRTVLLVSSLAGAGATFLPWINIPFIGAINGTSEHLTFFGWATFICFGSAVLILLLGKDTANNKRDVGLLSIASAIIGIYFIYKFKSRMADHDDNLFSNAMSSVVTIGFGLYLVIIAGITSFLTAFFGGKKD